MFDSAATIAIIGILGSTVGGLMWVIKYVFSELKPVLDQILLSTQANTKSTEANTEAALQAAKASEEAAKVSAIAVSASQEAVKVTKHADDYLRQRNGRDNEMHTELLAGMKEIPNAMNLIAKKSVESVEELVRSNRDISEQHVGKQIIDSQEKGK